MEKATFAGGCFWCMVKPFDSWDGIHKVTSGYMGGHIENPTYEDVKKGTSGHLEVVEIQYDPSIFPYKELLQIFWQQIDPTDAGGQFQDRGESYQVCNICTYRRTTKACRTIERTTCSKWQVFKTNRYRN